MYNLTTHDLFPCRHGKAIHSIKASSTTVAPPLWYQDSNLGSTHSSTGTLPSGLSLSVFPKFENVICLHTFLIFSKELFPTTYKMLFLCWLSWEKWNFFNIKWIINHLPTQKKYELQIIQSEQLELFVFLASSYPHH